ncbi:MAG TPA: class I SAM-dependent methyltransferase [Pseudonocardia sp.]
MTEPVGWGDPLYAHALDAADVGAGTSVLDLGCGTGGFARLAVARGARVVGVDADPAAVGVAAAAVPEGRFRTGDAHDLGPADALGGPFAVVAAMQLLTHVANPLRVLREASRVAVRGGTLVASVWGREEECDVGLFAQALAPWLPPRPPAGPPTLRDPDHLRKVAWLAGLAVVGVDEVVCPFDYADEAALLDPLLASGIGRAAVASAVRRGVGRSAAERAVRGAVRERFAGRRVGDGYRLRNLFRVLVARCPG